MRQLNGLSAYISAVPDDMTIVINLDTSNFDAFAIPTVDPLIVLDPAQVLPIGDSNTGQSSPGGTPPFPNTVPGAFNVTLFP
jgi:hypothetical protein